MTPHVSVNGHAVTIGAVSHGRQTVKLYGFGTVIEVALRGHRVMIQVATVHHRPAHVHVHIDG